MKLHKYSSYEEYKNIQISCNKQKINRIWVIEDNIKFLSSFISEKFKPNFGICHGTRRGLEQKWFSKYLKCKVIGTEISDTAKNFPNTVQMDFHDLVPEWHEKADFVYSNSFDHACYPEKAFKAWFDSIKPGGLLILEYTSRHHDAAVCETDPFGATAVEIIDLVYEWLSIGNNWVLNAPSFKRSIGDVLFLVFEKCR